jgi:hypothetical protein
VIGKFFDGHVHTIMHPLITTRFTTKVTLHEIKEIGGREIGNWGTLCCEISYAVSLEQMFHLVLLLP